MALAREAVSSDLHFRDIAETPGGGALEGQGWRGKMSSASCLSRVLGRDFRGLNRGRMGVGQREFSGLFERKE